VCSHTFQRIPFLCQLFVLWTRREIRRSAIVSWVRRYCAVISGLGLLLDQCQDRLCIGPACLLHDTRIFLYPLCVSFPTAKWDFSMALYWHVVVSSFKMLARLCANRDNKWHMQLQQSSWCSEWLWPWAVGDSGYLKISHIAGRICLKLGGSRSHSFWVAVLDFCLRSPSRPSSRFAFERTAAWMEEKTNRSIRPVCEMEG
jgi:hypothetical protein